MAETGIGGIHLVHELMAGYDALIVVDTVDRGRPPGTVMVIEAEVIDVEPMPVEQRHDLLADMHLATPERALMVARAVGVLPERTIIVGCQPVEIETLGIGLTHQVTSAVDAAVAEIHRCLDEIGGGTVNVADLSARLARRRHRRRPRRLGSGRLPVGGGP